MALPRRFPCCLTRPVPAKPSFSPPGLPGSRPKPPGRQVLSARPGRAAPIRQRLALLVEQALQADQDNAGGDHYRSGDPALAELLTERREADQRGEHHARLPDRGNLG